MILRAEHLVKKYKTRTVVNDVSVQVKTRRNCRIARPERRGKDNVILYDGWIDQTQRRTDFSGRRRDNTTSNVSTGSQGNGYLAQEALFLENFTVEENIMSVLRNARIHKAATEG